MNIKKLIASVTAVAMIATQAMTSIATVNAASVNPEWTAAVNFMKTEGLSSVANSVEEYMPMATVTREQAAKFFTAFAEKEFGKTADTTVVCNFADINNANPVFVPYITKACQMGIIKGANGKFMPKASLTKLQFLTILARIVKNNPNLEPQEAFNLLKADGITKAASVADTVRPVSRIELAILFQRATEKYAQMDDNGDDNIDDVLGDLLGGDDNTDTTTGDNNTDTDNTDTDDTTDNVVETATVVLSPESPVDGTAPAKAPRTPIVAFDVTAGDTDVVLDEISLKYTGLSDAKHVEDLAVYLGADKVTKGTNKTFDSENERDLSFEKDTVVKAGETRTFVVTATLTGGVANETHQVTIVSVKSKAGELAGTPLVGPKLTPVDATNVAKLDLDADTADEEVNIGEEVKLAGFTLEETTKKEDVIFKSVTLTVSGSIDAEDDLADIKILADGKVIASDLTVNNDDEIVAELDYTIPADEEVEFEVRGTVTAGAGDTIELVFDDANNDIYAIGASTKIPVKLNITDDNIADPQTIKGADINVSFDKSDIDEAKPDAEDVLVGTLNITTANDNYTVNKLKVEVESTLTGVANVISKIELAGQDYDNVENENTTGATYYFEDIDLVNGKLELPLTVDIEDDSVLNGESLTFKVSFVEIEDNEDDKKYTSTSNPSLNDILSSNTFSDKVIDIKTANIDVATVTVNDRDLVLGNGIAVLLYKGKINIGDADSVKIKALKAINSGSVLSNSADFKDIIDTATLNIDGKTFDGIVNADNIDFSSVNAVLPAGASNVEVVVSAILKDNDKIQNGDTLKFAIELEDSDLRDSDNERLVSGNVTVDTDTTNPYRSNVSTTVTLLDRGTLTIELKNDPDTDDNLENTVLAGSSNVTLAELEMEAEYEDVKVKEMTVTLSGGDFSDTLNNVRLVNVDNNSTIVANGIVTFDGTNTVVTFKDDFVLADADDNINVELVADLTRYTTEGGEVSAKIGKLQVISVNALPVDVKGVSSNDEITPTITNTAGEEISIVPVIVTVAVTDKMGTDDKYGKIKFVLDKGDNKLDNDDIVVTKIYLESAQDGGVTVRNDSNKTVADNVTGAVIECPSASTATQADCEINSGDEWEFKAESTGVEVRINTYGVEYSVDLNDNGTYSEAGEVFTTQNDSVLDLGEYTN